MIYGAEGTQALFTGLATQVVYGGCDADTAEFYSKASGTATTDANTDDPNSHLRQRPLLTVDEVITPQVVMNARLTRFYERDDWKQRLGAAKDVSPLLLERGFSLDLRPAEAVVCPALVIALPEATAVPKPTLELAASALTAKVAAETQS